LGKDAFPGGIVAYQGTDHHHRDKVGHIGNGLNGALERRVVYFVEEQGKDDRGGETEKDVEGTDRKGIPDKPEKIRVFKKAGKVFHPHPGASGHAQIRPEILKGNQEAVYRFVGKDNKIDQYRQDKEVLVFILVKILSQSSCQRRARIPLSLNAAHIILRHKKPLPGNPGSRAGSILKKSTFRPVLPGLTGKVTVIGRLIDAE
jgi:hypothetical protein